MSCLTCKNGTMQDTKTTYFAKLEHCYVIIENVPCMKCEQCGEEFFTLSVLEKIDDVLEHLEKIASKIFIGAMIPDEIPNTETIQSFTELENGNGHKFSGTTEELFLEFLEE